MNVLDFSEVLSQASHVKLLFSLSHSNAFILVHVIKCNFNSTFCCRIYVRFTDNVCVADVRIM